MGLGVMSRSPILMTFYGRVNINGINDKLVVDGSRMTGS